MWFPPEQQKLLDEAFERFPATFGLRNYEGTFRINHNNSYVSENVVYLYTDIKLGEEWKSFAKGTIQELTLEIRAL